MHTDVPFFSCDAANKVAESTAMSTMAREKWLFAEGSIFGCVPCQCVAPASIHGRYAADLTTTRCLQPKVRFAEFGQAPTRLNFQKKE